MICHLLNVYNLFSFDFIQMTEFTLFLMNVMLFRKQIKQITYYLSMTLILFCLSWNMVLGKYSSDCVGQTIDESKTDK